MDNIKKKPEVEDAVFGARVFYFLFHFLGILCMVIYECDIQQDLKNLKLGYPLFLLSIFIISSYLFMTCGNNPGYAQYSQSSSEKFDSFKDSDKEDQNSNSDENKKQGNGGGIIIMPLNDIVQNKKKISNDNDKNQIELQPMSQSLYMQMDKDDIELGSTYMEDQSKQNNLQIKSKQLQNKNDDIEEKILDFDEDQEIIAKRFYCPKCNIRQQYRTKHCDMCNRCITKFDHHCFWIGGCVGELNHRTFWLFLMFQTIFVTLAFRTFWYGMDNYSHYNDQTRQFEHDNAYGAFAVFSFICILFIFFTGILWVYHTFLICTNQSTWEHASRNKITYTSIYPRGFYPFDQGIINNIKTVFCHHGYQKIWKLPSIKEAQFKAQNSFNIFENQYYSCC